MDNTNNTDDLNKFIEEFSNVEQSIEKKSGLDNVVQEGDKDNTTLSNPEQYFICTFKHDDTIDSKTYIKFIKSVESLVRTSYEYSQYIGYLRNDLNMNKCQIMQNITDENANLEFHHHPFTLFTIVQAVFEKMLKDNGSAQTFEVADQVLKLHYDNVIGLVPLSKTAHDLVHAGDIFIHPNQLFGKVIDFIKEYKDHIDENEMKNIAKYIQMTNNNFPTVQKDVLQFNTEFKFKGKDFLDTQDVFDCNVITKDGKK